MIQRTADVVVIGAGTAGLNAFRQARKAGRSALLIEAGPYGTTCARVGCMPSKLLIAASQAAHRVRTSPEFGIVPGDWRIDGRAVMARVRRVRDGFVDGVVRDVEAIPQDQRLSGAARFVAPTVVRVGDTAEVRARAIVIATGSRPWVPPPFDRIREHVLLSDDIFALDEPPDSLAVIGTGAIGLELGQAFARLGVRVAAFNPFGDIGLLSDPKVAEAARAALSAEMGLHLGSEVVEAQPEGGGVSLRWRDAAGEVREDRFQRVLAAAGRRADLAPLDLAQAGLPLDDEGRPPWDARTTQCADRPIFLAGDASGHRAVLHEAADEGRIAGENAARYPDVTAHLRRETLGIAFTQPQMAVVGTRHADLPDTAEIGEASFETQGRARVIGQACGLTRLYADRQTDALVGAELLGPEVEHMAHLLAWSIQVRLSVQRLLEMPVYHPVLEEGLRTALRDLAKALGTDGLYRCEDMADVPGC